MPKRSSSQHVPKAMQVRFEEISQLTDAFCQKPTQMFSLMSTQIPQKSFGSSLNIYHTPV